MKKKYEMTKKERLKAYKFMLEVIEQQLVIEFCTAFFRFQYIHKQFSKFTFEEHLPELMEYKPKNAY